MKEKHWPWIGIPLLIILSAIGAVVRGYFGYSSLFHAIPFFFIGWHLKTMSLWIMRAFESQPLARGGK